jgi:hypothetical protein
MVAVVRRFSILLFGLAAVLVAGCGSRQEPDPIAHMTQALGGRAAIDHLRSLSVSANCAGPGGYFRTWVESWRPGRVHFRQSDGVDSVAVWSTPDSTWLSDGSETVAGDERVRAFVRGHEFHMDLFEIDSRFSNHAVAGRDTVEGIVCTRVDMTDEDGNPAAIFIADKTGLPRVLELNPPGAAGTVRLILDDWRKVSGLMVFFSFTMSEGPERSFVYRYTEIVPNQVRPEIFDPRQFR